MKASALPGWSRERAWIWYLAVTGLLSGLYLFAPGLSGNGPLINFLGLTGVLAIVAGIRMHKPAARAAWWLFAAGQFLFFSGDLYTYSYPKLLGVDVGFPSIGDALYLLVYPVLMAGLFILVRRRSPRPDRAALIDALILTIGIGLLSWVFLIAPNVHLENLSLLANAVSVAYPLGDVLLLAAAIRLAVDAGKRSPAFWLLVSSIVCLMATDSAYNFALLKDTYNHQLIYDAGWIFYYLLWGAAALHPSMRSLEEPAADSRTPLTPLRLTLLGAACLIAPGIRLAQSLGNPDVLVLIVASAVLFLLVVVRMAGLVRQEARVVSRERALRGAGVELVAAAGNDQVATAAISAVHRLLGAEPPVRLVLIAQNQAVVEASSDGATGGLVGDGTRDWLSNGSGSLRVLHSDPPAYVRGDLRLPEGQTTMVAPLTVRGDVRGALVVSSPESVTRDLADALGALATQVSLAVEGASLAADLHRRQGEARFRSLVAHASDLITVLDGEGVVTYQSPSIERVLGYRSHEVEGRRFDRLLVESDRPLLAQLIALDGPGEAEGHTIECSVLHRDGTPLTFEVQHTDLLHDEHVHGIVLNSRDVSERKAFEEQLAHQAFHDPVTKLANRALFSDRVEHALMRSTRGVPEIAVMFIDLDDFKTVNDSLGHTAGDEVLQEVGRRLKIAVRPTDTVARFGGDEFAVLLDGVDGSAEAADAASRILRALELPIEIDGKNVVPRASVGICLVGEDLETPEATELLRNADVAMYMAKRDSKGSYRVFEPTMHERVVERLELRSDLQHALSLNQLELHYQPVVRLSGREILGVEALVRWNHPTRGTIPPVQFIPVAEETGLIIPMGRWILETACYEGVRLQERFAREEPLTMSVNLSVRQLQSETLVADVRSALSLTGLPASSLVLEITESLMLTDTEFAMQQLHDLKGLGIRLAMDDFGTGYSSLSYLSRFPVDILKMDRSFVGSEDNEALTSAIIALGTSLSLEVVAEGIELAEQANSLEELGCELGQGYLFARPMDAAALSNFLALAEPAQEDIESPSASNAA
ncbi:MAG TPA: EAL domain-containing protein [Gaiellaceae bacterium]|jgi:diguanylate cyclase (GGDEF)-like protein/PAS domain S-box-containing protein|nr:EAL domain-containing protein [Gaiellaceae bacterium]